MGFWKMLNNIADIIAEKAPGIISTLNEKAAEYNENRNEDRKLQIKQAEYKVSRAEKSNKMNNPAYSKKVNEAKQNIEKAREYINK